MKAIKLSNQRLMANTIIQYGSSSRCLLRSRVGGREERGQEGAAKCRAENTAVGKEMERKGEERSAGKRSGQSGTLGF